ncbi:transcriptional regulator SlyA [compost metagenome]
MLEQMPGVTRLLDRLEAKAYIRRQRCTRDRRQHLCWLSSDGARLLESLKPAMASGHDRALAGVTGTDRQRLIAFLDAIALEK